MCVLFVEDEALIAMVVEDALRGAGHDVMTAGDAPTAVTLLRQHPGKFTALVSDYHMPGELTGVDLIEHTLNIYPTIPAIVATGQPGVINTGWLADHGVELLAKPYTPESLVSLIEQMLRRVG